MDLGFRSFHRSGSIIYVKRIFSDCPGFSVGFGFLGFSGTGCLVSPVCGFGGFPRFGFGFVWILDFLVSLRTVFQLDFGFLDLGFGFWFF